MVWLDRDGSRSGVDGRLSLAINQMTVQQFEEIFQRVSHCTESNDGRSIGAISNTGAWFGFTLLALLILVSVATMLVRYRNYRMQSCAIYF